MLTSPTASSHRASRSSGAHRPLPRRPRFLVDVGRVQTKLTDGGALTVVRAPQGYGKTAQVLAWLERQPHPVIPWWVSAGEASAPDRCGDLVRAELADLEDLLTGSGAPPRVVVVIDDFHLVPGDLARNLLGSLRRHRSLRLVVCTRRQHPLETLAAGVVDTTTVSARDLLLDRDEISALAARLGVEVTGVDVSTLAAATGGWPAAVRQVLDVTEPAASGLPLSRAEEYLRETVLPAVADEPALATLSRFALARRLSVRLVRDLATDVDADDVLATIENTGLADRRYGPDDVELILPTLVRTVLADSTTRDDPVGAEEMHRQLGQWYLSHDGVDHALFAFQHAAEAADWATLERVWVRHSAQLSMSRPRAVSEVLLATPLDVVLAHPSMLIARTLSRVAAEVLDAEPDAAIAHLRAYVELAGVIGERRLDGLPLHDLLYAGTGHLMGLRMSGRLDDAERLGDDIAERTGALAAAGDDPGDRLAWFHLQRGITWMLRARPEDARHSFERGWQLGAGAGSYVRSFTAANLALNHAVSGSQPAALRWLERHRCFGDDGSWGQQLIGAAGHLAAGLLALDRLDGPGCSAELARLDGWDEVPELWPYLEYLRAEYALYFGDPAAALDHLADTLRARRRELHASETASILLTRAHANLLTCCHRAQQAKRVLDEHRFATHPSLAVPLARLELLSDCASAARAVAATALDQGTAGDRDRQELHLLKAQAAYRMGERCESVPHVRYAVRRYESTGLLRAFATLPRAERVALLDNAHVSLGADALARLGDLSTPYPCSIRLVRLTKREQVLADHLAHTASRQEIAERLFVSVNTVRKQLVALYRKLDAGSREEALMRIAQLGLAGRP